MKLHGKVAIVTGGAMRLGRAFALALADAGCDVCVHYGRSEQAARATAEAVRRRGRRAAVVAADLLKPEQAARRVLSATTNELGRADVLVNNAAIFEPGTCADTTREHWDRHFAINLEAPFHLCREFAAQSDGHRGQIANIADWRATRPLPGHLAYTLSKSGLVTLTKILARELAPDIQVNAIAPGAILPAAGTESKAFQRLAEETPLQRTGHPGDVTEALMYLLRSDFVTGEVIHVAGGRQL
ncbi:MAG: SDR family NAD(P)-dependent oxidoreductase [Planctomycetaceae bacterium]